MGKGPRAAMFDKRLLSLVPAAAKFIAADVVFPVDRPFGQHRAVPARRIVHAGAGGRYGSRRGRRSAGRRLRPGHRRAPRMPDARAAHGPGCKRRRPSAPCARRCTTSSCAWGRRTASMPPPGRPCRSAWRASSSWRAISASTCRSSSTRCWHPLTLFAWRWRRCPCLPAVALLACVPFIPASIMAVQKIAQPRHAAATGARYSDLGGRFLEAIQGLATLKIYPGGRAGARAT